MNEEDRRELIARQHRALYGQESGNFGDESHTPRPSHPASGNNSAGGREASPRTYDPYAMGQATAQGAIAEAAGQRNANDTGPSPKPQQGRSRADSTSSPASNPPSQNFSLFENAQQSSRTSTSSPGGSPPRPAKTSNPGVAPIGTRPAQNSNPILTKRSTTPSPSPLGYGFTSSENQNLTASSNGNERSTSAASNPPNTKDTGMGGNTAWGNGGGGGVWGNKSLQASVWG